MSLMRKALLAASTNAFLRERALKPQGINTILTRLGENITHIDEAKEVFDHYMTVIGQVKSSSIDAQISIKPTQLGYDQNPDLCYDYCIRLLQEIEATGNFFWLDMESSPYVEGTITLFKRLRAKSDRVGIAIQAYLFRTEKDIEELVALGSAIRLVKGAYLEPPTVAFPNKADVDENYFKICSRLLQEDALNKPGALLHIATHDIPLQERLMKVIADRKIPADRYEFAMLFG